MASENNEISEIVKKCKILLLDIEGTTTSISFVKDKLFPYAEANVKAFLENQWEDEEVKEVVAALRKLSIEDQDKNVEGVVTIPGDDASKEEQIEGLVKSVQWQMSVDRKAGPLKELQGLIWKQGYDKGDIKGHVYDDVAPALNLWRSTEGQKVYIYSSGSVQAQKLLFSRSVAGDLLPHIEGHFDTAIGAKQEATSYAAIVEKVGCQPEDMLFLTDIVKEAEAARASGLQAALVSREGNAPLPTEASASYPVLHSFDQLTVSNKRKPEPQDEEVPAKVPKTDIEADVKTATEKEVTDTTPDAPISSEKVVSPETIVASDKISATEPACKDKEPEKMEVEEETLNVETAAAAEEVVKESEKDKEASTRIETTIEEITNSNEAEDAPVCDIEPVIEESVEKTEKNETEMMETESAEIVENVDIVIEPKEPTQEKIDEQSSPVTEETPTPGVTVEEITNNQEIVGDAEIVDVSPLVEEPPVVEMDDLKNVGDVLEKECDEILSKVQDVTNLDNIPVKPLLSSIAEEPVASENGENTNDIIMIVESILDSEMELTKKASVEANTAEQKPEKTKAGDEDANIKEENKLTANIAVTEDVTGNITEVNKVTEKEAHDKNDITENKVTENDVVDKKDTENVIKQNKVTDNDVKDKKENVADDVIKENKVIENDVNDAKVNEDKIEENGTTVAVTEEIKKDECAEVTNGEKLEEKMETTDSLVKSESNVIEVKMKEANATLEIVENKTNTEIGPSGVEKIESEEITPLPLKDKPETKENSTEAITEYVESKMETEEITTGPKENKQETKENSMQIITESVENKPETKTVAEPVDDKLETKEIVDSEMESVETTNEPVEDKKNIEVNAVENKVETKDRIIDQVDNKMKSESDIAKPVENRIESEEKTSQENKIEERNSVTETAVPENKGVENNTETKDTPDATAPSVVAETKENATDDEKMETEGTQTQVNGKTNGEPETNLNGNASKDEELSARLSVENRDNGKEMNGANGNGESANVEKGQGDNKVEQEITEIKVKTVASEEPRTDPIEQPVEA